MRVGGDEPKATLSLAQAQEAPEAVPPDEPPSTPPTTDLTEISEEIAAAFTRLGWTWGLELAGIPEWMPKPRDIALRLATMKHELLEQPHGQPSLVAFGRVVLVLGQPPGYENHIRVLLDIGEIPIP